MIINWLRVTKSLFTLFAAFALFWSAATVGAAAKPADSFPEASLQKSNETVYAYVGSRTTKERKARGLGINVYRVDPSTGNWTHVQLLKAPQENPSYLAFDRQHNYLYSVHGDFSEVSSYKIDKQTGQISSLNMESTKGKNPVFLVTDPTNKYLIVANYATGSVVSLPINADGSLAPLVDLVQLQGKPGPHRTQQGSSHPHQTIYDPSEKFILVPDKGLDRVFTLQFDATTGYLTENPPSIQAREGAGTRHAAFHPSLPFVYVTNELDSTVTTYSYNSYTGELKALQIIPSLPQTYTGNNTNSGIIMAPSGKYLYVSNRGHDSVAIYAVDQKSGTLTPIGWESSQGKGPRFITFDPTGEFLYAANENSDSIVTYRANSKTGKLTPTGQIVQTGSPVCIVFAKFSN